MKKCKFWALFQIGFFLQMTWQEYRGVYNCTTDMARELWRKYIYSFNHKLFVQIAQAAIKL